MLTLHPNQLCIIVHSLEITERSDSSPSPSPVLLALAVSLARALDCVSLLLLEAIVNPLPLLFQHLLIRDTEGHGELAPEFHSFIQLFQDDLFQPLAEPLLALFALAPYLLLGPDGLLDVSQKEFPRPEFAQGLAVVKSGSLGTSYISRRSTRRWPSI